MRSGRKDNGYHDFQRTGSAKVRGTRLRPRLIEGDSGEALLAVFNDSRTQRLAERISVPPEYRTLMDIDRNEAVPLDGGALKP